MTTEKIMVTDLTTRAEARTINGALAIQAFVQAHGMRAEIELMPHCSPEDSRYDHERIELRQHAVRIFIPATLNGVPCEDLEYLVNTIQGARIALGY